MDSSCWGLLLGLAVGEIFVPAVVRSVPGASMIEDIPVGQEPVNTVLVWGIGAAVATLGS